MKKWSNSKVKKGQTERELTEKESAEEMTLTISAVSLSHMKSDLQSDPDMM